MNDSSENILCIPNRAAFQTGVHPVTEDLFREYEFLPRTPELEQNEAYRQIIPYVLIWHAGKLLTYTRAGSEGRLHNKTSLGFGGHVEESDKNGDSISFTLSNAARREIHEELGIKPPWINLPRHYVIDNGDAVGRVHLGLIYQVALFDQDYVEILAAFASGDISEIKNLNPIIPEQIDPAGLEGWSRIVLGHVLNHRQAVGRVG